MNYAGQYSDHRLQLVAVSTDRLVLLPCLLQDSYSIWRMAKPGANAASCVLMFTPAGPRGDPFGRVWRGSVTIVGDWIPVKPATTTLVSKGGLEWFSKPHTPDYLVPHFLEREWSRKEAIQDLSLPAAADLFEGLTIPGELTPLEEAMDTLQDYDREDGGYGFFEYLIDIGVESEDAVELGMAYNPDKWDHLVAIHATFWRLYMETPPGEWGAR